MIQWKCVVLLSDLHFLDMSNWNHFNQSVLPQRAGSGSVQCFCRCMDGFKRWQLGDSPFVSSPLTPVVWFHRGIAPQCPEIAWAEKWWRRTGSDEISRHVFTSCPTTMCSTCIAKRNEGRKITGCIKVFSPECKFSVLDWGSYFC